MNTRTHLLNKNIRRLSSNRLTQVLLRRSICMRTGFTLIESLIASVILASVAAAVLVPFTAAIESRNYSSNQLRAQRAAVSLVERIITLPLEDPDASSCRDRGPDSGESSTSQYDNIDDWHGYSDTISDDGYENLSRSVSVSYISPSGQPTRTLKNCCRVTVSVSDFTGELISISRIVYGAVNSR